MQSVKKDSKSATHSSHASQLQAVTSLMYLPIKGSIVAVTADFNFCSVKILQPKTSEFEDKQSSSSVDFSNCLEFEKLVVGCNDEILDIAILPSPKNDHSFLVGQDENTSFGEVSVVEQIDGLVHLRPFKIAVITNSAQVRIMDESFKCVCLEGHLDIVLALDVSPDGYVHLVLHMHTIHTSVH